MKRTKTSKIRLFLYYYFTLFILLSIGISILSLTMDLVSFFLFDSKWFVPVPIKYYFGLAIMSFFITIYSLWIKGVLR
ncbi:hypothetical protein A6A10_06755 [Otariodibacter oris]|uniref:Uncharacterized protein n=1 Tax=Otariodibacter oris TaxID=1032623 RepID=A0A420XGW2_9PAST|nr:hypothetical protein A6A10_06755 [Otariodibacter oris]RKR72677.1 hypothetical protein DES31_0841 [Otariodibacter oris]